MRFSPGTSGMPFGTAQDTATPSRSRRRSQCSRVALCSCTTKRAPAPASVSAGAGSGVAPKSRFARYSPSSSGVGVARGRDAFFADDFAALDLFVGVTVFRPAEIRFRLLGEAVQIVVVLGVLGVLDQELLRLLEAILLSAAGLVHGLPRRVVASLFWCLHAGHTTPGPEWPTRCLRRAGRRPASTPAIRAGAGRRTG